jgi:hypothetical protein
LENILSVDDKRKKTLKIVLLLTSAYFIIPVMIRLVPFKFFTISANNSSPLPGLRCPVNKSLKSFLSIFDLLII